MFCSIKNAFFQYNKYLKDLWLQNTNTNLAIWCLHTFILVQIEKVTQEIRRTQLSYHGQPQQVHNNTPFFPLKLQLFCKFSIQIFLFSSKFNPYYFLFFTEKNNFKKFLRLLPQTLNCSTPSGFCLLQRDLFEATNGILGHLSELKHLPLFTNWILESLLSSLVKMLLQRPQVLALEPVKLSYMVKYWQIWLILLKVSTYKTMFSHLKFNNLLKSMASTAFLIKFWILKILNKNILSLVWFRPCILILSHHSPELVFCSPLAKLAFLSSLE